MKACGELEVTPPRIVNFGTRMRRIVSYRPPATLPAGEKKPPRSTGWVGLRVASEAASKVVPVKAVNAKGHRGSGGIVSLILNLGSRWVEWSASCASGFTPGQREPVTTELEGQCTRQSRSECF